MDADDVMTCPAGVALLESLEAEQRSDAAWFHALTTSDAAAVDRAATAMSSLTWGGLVERLVSASERVGGPWASDALSRLTLAFELARGRRPIAEAIAAHFDSPSLHRPQRSGVVARLLRER